MCASGDDLLEHTYAPSVVVKGHVHAALHLADALTVNAMRAPLLSRVIPVRPDQLLTTAESPFILPKMKDVNSG